MWYMQLIDVSSHSAASADAVYHLLADGSTWPTWSPIDSFTLDDPGQLADSGDSQPEGLDAIRIFRTGRSTSRERVVERVPGRRLSYVLLAGLPLRGYRADVDLTPASGGGTDITWQSSFTAKVPGTGWLYRQALRRFIQRCADGLAAYAAAPAAAPRSTTDKSTRD
jgi:hypothetical protein